MRKLLACLIASLVSFGLSQAWGAPANVQHNLSADGSGGSGSLTIVLTGTAVGSANTVVGSATWAGATTDLISITDDKGNIYNVVDSVANSGQAFATFYLQNITNAPSTITVTFSTLRNFSRMSWDEFSGVALTTPLDGHSMQANAGNTGTDAQSSGNFTTAANGDLIWGAITNPIGASVLAAGTGFSILNNSSGPNNDMATEWRVQGSAGLIAATFTETTSSPQIVGGLALKASGSPASSCVKGSLALMGAGC